MLWHFPSSMHWISHNLRQQMKNWPHVWWISAGALAQLPIHAAGYHSRKSGETVIDSVISSYSSSIKELLYGRRRRRAIDEEKTWGPKQALLVSMPETPHQQHLVSANQEVTTLRNICKSMQLTPIEPMQRDREHVLECLRTCFIFHFAGHGLSHPQGPFHGAHYSSATGPQTH